MIRLIDGHKGEMEIPSGDASIIDRRPVNKRIMMGCYNEVLEVEAENKAELLFMAIVCNSHLITFGGPKLGPRGMGWDFYLGDTLPFPHEVYYFVWHEQLAHFFKHAVNFVVASVEGFYVCGFEMDTGDIVLFGYNEG